MDERRESWIKMTLDSLFRSSPDEDLNAKIGNVSDYFSYLADNIDYEQLNIEVRKDLIDCFESVYLWLREKLQLYPDSIREQVDGILSGRAMCELFALMSNLSEEHLLRLRRRQRRGPVQIVRSGYSLFGLRLNLQHEKEDEYISGKKLLEAKVALRRAAQLLKFASSQSLLDYDSSFQEFKQHYDPNLINKHKLLTLINYLRVQVGEIPEDGYREVIFKRLNNLEAELRRPGVRWGVVITGFFVLFGFLADLKTLAPDVYSKSFETVRSIISVLHDDALVAKTVPALAAPDSKTDSKDTDKWKTPFDHEEAAILRERSAILKEEDVLEADGEDVTP